MLQEMNRIVVERFTEEVWNRGNLAVIDEVVAPAYVRYQSGLPEPIQGREGMKRYVAAARATFPDWWMRCKDVLATGDRVIVRFSTHARVISRAHGAGVANGQVEITGITIFRIAGGQIAEEWTVFDQPGLLQCILMAMVRRSA